MAQIGFKSGSEEDIRSLEHHEEGYFYIAEDTKKAFLMINGMFFKIGDIEELQTDEDRLSLETPTSKLYFVIETNSLWKYDDGWVVYVTKDLLDHELETKLDIHQGEENIGKYLIIGEEGNITPGNVADVSTTVFKQSVYETTMDLTANIPVVITLPTAISSGLITQLFVDGILFGYDGRALNVISGNKLEFTPTVDRSDAVITVFYPANPNELPKEYQYVDFKINIEEANTEVQSLVYLSFYNEASVVTIDFGDGTIEDMYCDITKKLTVDHTYAEPGAYTVQIVDEYGQLNACLFNQQSVKCVTKMFRYEGEKFNTLSNVFAGMTTDLQLDYFQFKTPNVVGLSTAFQNCGIESIPEDIFEYCVNVTTCNNMFIGSSIKHIPGKLFHPMRDSLENAGGFIKQTPALETVGPELFKDFKKLTKAPQCFLSCINLTSVGDSLFEGCENLEDINGLFNGCKLLTKFPANVLTGCSSVTTLYNFAPTCESITEIAEDIFWDCTEVTDIRNMLKAAKGITKLPADLFKYKHQVQSADAALQGMSGLLEVGDGLLNPIAHSITSAKDLLYNSLAKVEMLVNDILALDCPNLNILTNMFRGGKLLTGSGLDLIALMTSPNITSTATCLRDCIKLDDYASLPAEWK